MQRILRFCLGIAIAVMLVAVPVGYGCYWQAQVRNFHVVTDGVLYRSGQMSINGLKRVVHDFGIKTVVTLRDAADPADRPPDWNEEQYCRTAGLQYVRILPRSWWSPDGSVPAEKGVSQFRAVMDNKENYPVLIHCFAGVHRTGAFCAVYRMEYQHWTNAEALAELRAHGYTHLDDEWDLLEYLEGYQPIWKNKLHAQGANSP